jgi:hypothetical protein
VLKKAPIVPESSIVAVEIVADALALRGWRLRPDRASVTVPSRIGRVAEPWIGLGAQRTLSTNTGRVIGDDQP